MTTNPNRYDTVVIHNIGPGGHAILRNRARFPFRAVVTDTSTVDNSFGFRPVDADPCGFDTPMSYFSQFIEWTPDKAVGIADEDIEAGDTVEISGGHVRSVLPVDAHVLTRVPTPGERVEVWRSTHFDRCAKVESVTHECGGKVSVVTDDESFSPREFVRERGEIAYRSLFGTMWLAEPGNP